MNRVWRKIVMRTIFIACIFLLASEALSAQQRVTKGQEPPSWPPATGKSEFILTPSHRSQSHSLKELIDQSVIIVDASVQEVLPARVLQHRLETDSVLSVNRVIKGSATLKSFVVSQNGGVVGGFTQEPRQYSMMQAGEHYLLFAKDEARTLPPVRDLPRYAIAGVWIGAVNVDIIGRLHFARGTPAALREQHDGTAANDFIAHLGALLP
jgi:hypothetical protein